ncbi:MAG: YlbF family regulator [Lachnospiraceae bacterium]|jgi:hypothetical protein|nr:YlbF family regulator [Lachnospiraceae bacterium]MEE3460992.1 YlbF family regulator [Lachnospiraceae bacterium]
MDAREEILNQLIDSVVNSEEHDSYVTMLEQLKMYPDLLERVGEFRKRCFSYQFDDNADVLAENSRIESEFSDILTNRLVSDFLAAERQYCSLIKKLNNRFYESLDLDAGFLKG